MTVLGVQANKNLKITITVEHKGRTLDAFSMEMNDDILGFKRERQFNLEHQIGQMAATVVSKALNVYDTEVIGSQAS